MRLFSQSQTVAVQNQSNCLITFDTQMKTALKPKPIQICLHVVSLAFHWLHVFAMSSDWFTDLSAVVVPGGCVHFTCTQHLIENHLISPRSDAFWRKSLKMTCCVHYLLVMCGALWPGKKCTCAVH